MHVTSVCYTAPPEHPYVIALSASCANSLFSCLASLANCESLEGRRTSYCTLVHSTELGI